MMRDLSGRAPYRGVVVCAALAIVAIVVGVTAVVFDEAVFALAAAVVGVVAAGVGALVDVRRSRAEDSLWEARAQARRLRRQLAQLQAAVAEEQSIAEARGAADAPGAALAADVPDGTDTGEWEIDPVSGMLRERHLPVLLQQVVAAARRKVQPVSVVFWELDGLDVAPASTRDQALTALGAVAWRTLRESDAMFRLGEGVAVAVLVDTAEPGAIIVADRVREALRSSPVGGSLTVSAGIACYPSHALDAAELVARAGRTLEAARALGHQRDHVAVATTE